MTRDELRKRVEAADTIWAVVSTPGDGRGTGGIYDAYIDPKTVIGLLDTLERYEAALREIATGGYGGASYVARKALEQRP